MIAWETKIMTECQERCREAITMHERMIESVGDPTGFHASCISDARQQMRANKVWFRQLEQATA